MFKPGRSGRPREAGLFLYHQPDSLPNANVWSILGDRALSPRSVPSTSRSRTGHGPKGLFRCGFGCCFEWLPSVSGKSFYS